MPCISQFYGIAIYMYYSDHAPPRFHAEYAGSEAEYSIDTLDRLEGKLPRRSQALVLEWAALHREELRENWGRARNGEPLNQLDPLE